MTWISVKDRLPPINENVLFFNGKKEVGFGFYRPEPPPVENWATENSIWMQDLSYCEIGVATHWMPLPIGQDLNDLDPVNWNDFKSVRPKNGEFCCIRLSHPEGMETKAVFKEYENGGFEFLKKGKSSWLSFGATVTHWAPILKSPGTVPTVQKKTP